MIFLFLCLLLKVNSIKHSKLSQNTFNVKNQKNDRPIIGIFDLPIGFDSIYSPKNYSSVDMSYVNFLEMAGARYN